jgi:aspartyl-tRNA(Asn)/glutamyl-tRNA(Gln) amidotransferase subunit A
VTEEELLSLIDDPSQRHEVSAVELTTIFLERISRAQSQLNAIYTTTAELAMSDAVRADRARSIGSPLPLDGLPIVVKDNIDVHGVRTTCGTAFLADYVAPLDATCVAKLRSAGAVVLGKAATQELAFGVTCNNAFYGPTRNPWDFERIPGGSSGGCGAALGADLAVAALGTDTGGSVRIPAALTGVSGLRPTYGAISTIGTWPSCPTFDTVGPMARNIHDLAQINDVMFGFDAKDVRAVDGKRVGLGASDSDRLTGLRIGVPRTYFTDEVEPDILLRYEEAGHVLSELGARLIPLELHAAAEASMACATIIKAEALSIHGEHLKDRPNDFSTDVRRRLALGDAISGASVMKAFKVMYDWRYSLRQVFETVDLVMTPTTATVAPMLLDAEMITTTTLLTRLTYPWSLGALPAVALPSGLNSDGLPTSVQLAAAPWADSTLMRVASAYQAVTSHHRLRPSQGRRVLLAEESDGSRMGLNNGEVTDDAKAY